MLSLANRNFVTWIDKGMILFILIFFFSEIWSHNYANGGGLPPILGIYLVFGYGLVRLFIQIDIFKELTKVGYFWWLFFFFLLLTANYIIVRLGLFHLYENDLQDVFNRRLTALGFSLSSLILLLNKEVYKFARLGVVIAVIFGTFINVLDIFDLTEKWGGAQLRAAGYYMNPNTSAIVLSMGFILTIDIVKKSLRLPYFLVYLLGALLPLSRGAFPVVFLIILYVLFKGMLSLKSLVITGCIGAIVGVVLSAFIMKNENTGMVLDMLSRNRSVQNRIATIFAPGETKFNAGVRDEVALDHLLHYAKSPIVGHGLSSSVYIQKNITLTNHSSHVLYIHMLNDYGIIGWLILFGMPFSLLIYANKIRWDMVIIIFGITYGIAGVSSHNLYDLRCFLFIYALVAAYRMHESRDKPLQVE